MKKKTFDRRICELIEHNVIVKIGEDYRLTDSFNAILSDKLVNESQVMERAVIKSLLHKFEKMREGQLIDCCVLIQSITEMNQRI